MIPATDVKHLGVIWPAAIKDNASWTTVEIDTLGYDFCTIVFQLGASDIAMSALKVQECDTTGGSFADVTGLVFGTSTNTAGSTSTLPSATDDDKLFVFEIDCRKRKRFLDLVATAGDGTSGSYGAAYAILSRAKSGVIDATGAGASQILRV